MATKIVWSPILGMDMEDGTHTCYSSTTADRRYVWLTQFPDGWHVERSIAYIGDGYNGLKTLAICKTLTSAKRYAARYVI